MSPGLEQRTIALAAPTPTTVVQRPELQTTVTTELGDTMISRSYVKYTEALTLQEAINHETKNFGMEIRVEIAPSVLKKIGQDEKGTYYAASALFKTLPAYNSRAIAPGGVYMPFAAGAPKLLYWSLASGDRVVIDRPRVPIAADPLSNYVEASSDNQRKELIYTGVSKNVITVIYREYKDDMARPAYTQELKYDLGEGRVIGFKGARFEVIEATNTGIRYRVLRHLD